jgi:hypothetical protein
VNVYTKVSQWDKPTSPVYASGEHAGASGPPPYDGKGSNTTGNEKSGSNTGTYGGAAAGGALGAGHDLSADEEMARKLQAEEDARAHGGGPTASRVGASDGYYQPQQGGQGQQYGGQYGGPQQQQGGYGGGLAPQQDYQQQRPTSSSGSKGVGSMLGKLLGKGKSQQQQPQYYQGHQMPGYPPQGYNQQQYMQQPGRRPGGMGMMGGAALGAGGGLLGGMMLGSAMHGGDGGDGT